MLEKIISIVKSAGQIMLQASHISDFVESKQGRANFVTKYDILVQDYLYRELLKLYPEAVFIGEEDKRRAEALGEYCFIVDPIDGTTNFIFDYRHSAISVALLHRTELVIGVVYNPYLNEIFYAEKGKKAYLNGRPLQVNNRQLSEGIVAFGTSPYDRTLAKESFRITGEIYEKALDVRRSGSAALDLCYVAAGRCVLFYELRLQPWDYAAGSLIITEAGAKISAMDKNSLPILSPSSVIAATPSAYEDFFQLIS